jgi:ribosomal-protein-serine acetyltransferase
MLLVPPRPELRARPLTTTRLVLAPIEVVDSEDMFHAVEASRKELEPWLPWVPFNIDPSSSYRYAEASATDWAQGRACRFGIRERTTRRFMGVVGLETLAHLHESCELGYWLRTDTVGRGYMTEASRALLDWAFGPLHAHRVRVAASTENHPSLAVIKRLGFRFEGIARQAERCGGRWLDHAVFALLDSDDRPKSG